MRRRLPPALVATLALAAASPLPARAQTPTATPTPTPTVSPTPTATPTPTPTATPAPKPSKAVRAVYRDYRRDGKLSPCTHPLKALKKTKKTLDPAFTDQYPDFELALDAAIDARKHCKPKAKPTPTPTPTPTATAAPTSTPAPAATPAPAPAPTSTPEPGLLPVGPGGSGSGGNGGAAKNPGSGSLPAIPTPTPTPTPTPVPTATPVPTPAGPAPLVVRRPDVDRSLVVPGALAGLSALGSLLLALSALLAQRFPRLAGMRHAWAEAALRARGAWSDFADWMRLGR